MYLFVDPQLWGNKKNCSFHDTTLQPMDTSGLLSTEQTAGLRLLNDTRGAHPTISGITLSTVAIAVASLRLWDWIQVLKAVGGAAAVSSSQRFFFCLFITRVRPMRSWRGYVQSVSCPLSTQWRLIASAPFALRPGLSQEDVKRTKGMTKERRASVRDKGENKGRETPARRLRRPCGRHEVRRGEEQWCPPGARLLGARSLLLQPLPHLQLRHCAHRIVLRLGQHPSSHIRGG